MAHRIAIIANPRAGWGKAEQRIRALADAARTGGMPVAVHETRRQGDGVRLGREVAGEADVVVIAGGDGTVHEVVNGLMPDPPPVVVIPSGTGNDFSSLFRCPATPEEFTRVIRGGVGARVDVMDLGGGRFGVNSVGLGFEGLVNRFSHGMGWLPGSLVYPAAVFRAMISLRCLEFEIETVEGERQSGPSLLISIGNGNRAGGSFFLTPDARPDDGLLDVCVVEAMPRRDALRLLPRAMDGGLVQRPEVCMLRTRGLTVRTPVAYPMHVDGELVDPAPVPLGVRLRERALGVLCLPPRTGVLAHDLEPLL